jgi:hypothetical protein
MSATGTGLGLRLHILVGERFKVGDVFVRLAEIKSPTCFVLEVEGGITARYQIRADQHPVEILPNVKVKGGVGDRDYRAVMFIDAPKHVRIERLNKEPDSVRFGPDDD